VPGQTVCKENGGVEFNWRPEHPLTVLRTYARQIADGSIVAGELTRRACARFLGDLENGASREIFIDPVAVQNIDIWFDKFGEPGLKLQPWELYIVGQILGWKRPTGLRRFRKAWLFNRVETKVSIATGLERLNCEGYGAIKHAYKPLPQSRNMPLRCESRTNSATRLVKWVGKVSGQRRKTRAAKTTLSMLDRSLEQSNQRGLRVEPQPS
jgi:hypothetical protein